MAGAEAGCQLCTVVGVFFVAKGVFNPLWSLVTHCRVLFATYVRKRGLAPEYGGKWAVNNVGYGGLPKKYAGVTEEAMWRFVHVNFGLRVGHDKGGAAADDGHEMRGIINISSISALCPWPYFCHVCSHQGGCQMDYWSYVNSRSINHFHQRRSARALVFKRDDLIQDDFLSANPREVAGKRNRTSGPAPNRDFASSTTQPSEEWQLIPSFNLRLTKDEEQRQFSPSCGGPSPSQPGTSKAFPFPRPKPATMSGVSSPMIPPLHRGGLIITKKGDHQPAVEGMSACPRFQE
ncbi:hypothetical protein GWK47_007684 [Chionoecetes opilio]|uniref:Uncharacterized protein n=1 Tax=Chionoecetes opilio TaxID=41210 RepID=A0A8J4Y1G4_CHIOP|nr:hypothetical protein GWK47_007684 [Chionoecetes opilio]